MKDKKRVDRIELGVMDRAKVIDVYAKEFICTAAGKVQGDLDAEIAEVRGACKIGGDVRTGMLKVGGSLKIPGDVRSELIRAKGALKVEGDVNSDHFRITGATKVLGNITSSEEIMVQGVLKCMGDVDANRFKLFGSVTVDKNLKAKEFTAELGGRSAIRNLEAEIISVKIANSRDSELLVKSIKGNEIHLENTVADSVEGKKVFIGPGCTISQIKAAELEVHKSSKVGKRV